MLRRATEDGISSGRWWADRPAEATAAVPGSQQGKLAGWRAGQMQDPPQKATVERQRRGGSPRGRQRQSPSPWMPCCYRACTCPRCCRGTGRCAHLVLRVLSCNCAAVLAALYLASLHTWQSYLCTDMRKTTAFIHKQGKGSTVSQTPAASSLASRTEPVATQQQPAQGLAGCPCRCSAAGWSAPADAGRALTGELLHAVSML